MKKFLLLLVVLGVLGFLAKQIMDDA